MVWQPAVVIDDFAKECLHQELRWVREALLWKLEGLSEYDVRRPLTVTGTNLLGLVKHAATWEARYFGEVFDRPFPEPLPAWEESDDSDLWVTEVESREQVVEFYHRACAHADVTITELPLDAPGHVPWWRRPEVRLFSIVVHVLNDTTRHAGHADILREHLDGRTGVAPGLEEPVDSGARAARWARIEQAARAASSAQA